MSSQNYNGFKFSGQNSNKLFPAGAQADLLKTHYDPKRISKLSSFLQELKHICSKPTMIQNDSPNKLFPAGAQAHLLKTHYDPKLISKLSSFLQELKHICSQDPL
jgi:hypothetical protein